MNARYGSLDLSDDMDGPPRFNFDPESLLPALAMTIGQPDVSGSSSKLNRRPASLQILSPRARAVNASQPSLQPPLPSLNNPSPRDKGKGRAVDIIELSDSDDDVKIVAPSNIKSTPGPSQPVPSTVATGTNQILPPASFEAITEPSTLPNLPQEEIAPRIASPPAQASIEGRVEALPREEPAVAGPSISNPLDRLIASVLEIIPDVDPAHLTVLFTTNNPGGDPQRAAQLLESILHSLLENGNYPKRQVEAKRKRQEERDIPTAGPSQPKRRKVETVVKMNVATTDRPRIPSMDYYKLSMYYLGVKFPYVRAPYLRATLTRHMNLYAPAFVHLMNLQNVEAIPADSKKRTPTRPRINGSMVVNAEFDRELNWCADWYPGKPGEIEYILESGLDRAGQPPQNGQSVTPKKSEEEETIESEECESGEGIECGCCYSEYVVTTMVQCPDGHLFCKACVFAFCKERLGQLNARIKCMDSQTDCQLEFMTAQLQLCLPPRLLALYERVKQADEISAAGLENLEECPFCEYKCVIDNENERLFHCVNEDCGIVSCRGCKKKDHIPKTCAEMEEDKTLDAQHVVEEAMTNALMRKCPKCQATFVKTDGCNKITCTKCKQLSCYICRQPIKGYDHFNQAAPGSRQASTSKCMLWDGPGGVGGADAGLAKLHHDEVAKAREEALAKVKQANPDVDVSLLKVDAPGAPTPLLQQQQRYPLPPIAYPPMPAMPAMPDFQLPMGPNPQRFMQYYEGRNQFGLAAQPPFIMRDVPAPAARRCNCPGCARQRRR